MIYVNGDTGNENLNLLVTLLGSNQEIPTHARAALVNVIRELQDRRKGVVPGKVGTVEQVVTDRKGYHRKQAVISYRYVCQFCGHEFEAQQTAGRKRTICDACKPIANSDRVKKHRAGKK
jgi:predicted restriction endonuclease